jgi:uncharacterized protein (TIGR03083 family)
MNAASGAERVAERALAARKRLGYEVRTAFDDTTDRFNHLVTRLTAEEAETACYHPGNILSVRTFVGLRLLELVIHGWDIRSQLEPSAPLSSESAVVLVGFWPAFVAWGFRPDPSLSTLARYRFALPGDMLSPYDIVVEGKTVRMEPAGEHPADVVFRCEAATFVLLMCGRHALPTLIHDGRVTVEGAGGLVAAFGKWFQGM